MSLFVPFRIASFEPTTGCPGKPVTGICMFDCPEQIQTSPIITLSSTIASPSLIRIE